MHSIKTKLIFALSSLIIFLFIITAFLLIDEKRHELSLDIYNKARSFSELTAPKVIDLYESLLAENSFVLFNREIKDIFAKDEDVSAIKIASFAGEVYYDSTIEQTRAYKGEKRTVQDQDLSARIKANLPSYLLANGRVVYLKKKFDGSYVSVNENEKAVSPIIETDVIKNIVYPLNSKYSVIFEISYANLQSRIDRTTQRIILLLVFGVLIGLGVAWFFSQRITRPIEKLTAGALVLAKGDFKARVDVHVKDEVGTLADTFNKMAGDLEISTKAMLEKEAMKRELDVAARIQKQILPKELPKIPGLDIATDLIPATEIGGDCYDFIKIDDDNSIIYIGDVTGHGVPSGIVVSIANAIIYSYASSLDMKNIIINANKVMKAKTVQNMFITMLMMRYNSANGNLAYVSAGHPEMLHFHGTDGKVSLEKGGGIAVGMVPDISKLLTESNVSFGSGDTIVLYTDGIPEGGNEKGEQYGMDSLKASLEKCGKLPTAAAIKDAIIGDIKAFMGSAVQLDDITIVVLKKA